MSCRLNGSAELRADLERRFANTGPEDVQIRDVSCLGRCDHAPAVSVNDHIFTKVTSAQAEQTGRSAIRGETIREPHPGNQVLPASLTRTVRPHIMALCALSPRRKRGMRSSIS